jgi:DNA-binding CsgD family transcriptional regulator
MNESTGLPRAPSLLPRILFRVFNALCCGAVLLDQHKAPIHVNERAAKFIGSALLYFRGKLIAADRSSDLPFQTILDQTLKYGSRESDWRRDALPLRRPDHRPLIARVIPVEGEAQAHLDGAALIVLIIDPEDCPHPSYSVLKQVFDLTRTEARIANEVLCDKTADEIAEGARVSVGTVRTQIKAIFAKTQTHRQAELVGLLTRLALISEGSEETAVDG